VTLATFFRFRISLDASSDPQHAVTAPNFDDDILAPGETTFGMYVQNIFQMKNGAGAFTNRERGMFGVHWINTTAGALDTTWVTADFTAVESAVQAFWNAIAPYIPTDCQLVEHRWYRFGPGVGKPNPPSRINTLGSPLPGTSAPVRPHQVAATVTLRTPLRKHWGRFYLPMMGAGSFIGGQTATSQVDDYVNAARTMLTAPNTSQGVSPVVWSRQRNVAYGVTAIEGDSVPDIIRRRRPRDPNYRKILTA